MTDVDADRWCESTNQGPPGERAYKELIADGVELLTHEQYLAVWIQHDGRPVRVAVVRLWMGLIEFQTHEELGTALEMLFDDERLPPAAREAAFVLARASLRQ